MIKFYRIIAHLPGFPFFLWAIALFFTIRPMIDPDYWWHLRVGEWIVNHRAVPRHDLLSWLTDGPWMAHEWLSEVILYVFHRVAGSSYGAIVFFGILIVAILAALDACLQLARPKLKPEARAWLVLITALVAIPVWLPRSQLWDVFFSLLTIWVLLVYLNSGRTRQLWILPPAMMIWANLHGGGILILIPVFAALLIGEVVNRRLGWSSGRSLRPLFFPLVATAVAPVVNPYGLSIYGYPFATLIGPGMQSLILEWHSPDFHQPSFRFAQFFIAGLLLTLGFIRVRDVRALLMTAGTIFMFLQSGRHLGLTAPLTVALTGPYIVDALELARRRLISPGNFTAPRGLGAVWLIGALLIVIIKATTFPQVADRVLKTTMPVAAVEWLASHPQPKPLFNTYGWGGYLSWRLRIEVGPYGAADAFTDAELAEFNSLAIGTIDPGAYLDAHQVKSVIWQADRPLAFWLAASPNWRLVYADQQAVIYTRAETKPSFDLAFHQPCDTKHQR